jgi:hypothetical protein
MPARNPDTVLSWPVARLLAAQAAVDPRTIQLAAKRHHSPGDAGRRARAAVNLYFREHPDAAPEGWTELPDVEAPPPPAPKPRPASAPLVPAVARELATEAKVDPRTIQRAAAGLTLFGESGRAARAAVERYFEAHPEARPKPADEAEPARVAS